jgi:hypothetical protein
VFKPALLTLEAVVAMVVVVEAVMEVVLVLQ